VKVQAFMKLTFDLTEFEIRLVTIPVDCLLGCVLALEELVEVLRTVRGREPASPSVFRDSYQLQLLIHFHNNIKNSSSYQLVYL